MILILESLKQGKKTISGDLTVSAELNKKYNVIDLTIEKNSGKTFYHDIVEYKLYTESMTLIESKKINEDSASFRKTVLYQMKQEDEDIKRSLPKPPPLRLMSDGCIHIGNVHWDDTTQSYSIREYFKGYGPRKANWLDRLLGIDHLVGDND